MPGTFWISFEGDADGGQDTVRLTVLQLADGDKKKGCKGVIACMRMHLPATRFLKEYALVLHYKGQLREQVLQAFLSRAMSRGHTLEYTIKTTIADLKQAEEEVADVKYRMGILSEDLHEGLEEQLKNAEGDVEMAQASMRHYLEEWKSQGLIRDDAVLPSAKVRY